MRNIRQTLINIEKSESFDLLESFKAVSAWKNFAIEDRLLFARLLVMQGAQQLAKGDHKVLENFEIANQVSSHALEILYEQATILSLYHNNIRCLNLASKVLECTVQKDPNFCKGWYLLGEVLTSIGLFENEVTYLIEAHQKFEKAHDLLESCLDIDQKDFYWKWGYCLTSLGKVSGEPFDLNEGIRKYQCAYDLLNKSPLFLNNFGTSLSTLAILLGKPEYLVDALDLFNEAIQVDSDIFEGWFNQGCCLLNLIELTSQDKLFEQADKSFFEASEINSQHSELWFRWGLLDVAAGKVKRDPEKFQDSLLKFSKAWDLDNSNSRIMISWVEAELFLSAQEEKFDLMQSAHTKIISLAESQPEDPHVWYLYGSCLNELGRYFSDENYYHHAIEKFKYGLSLTSQYSLLWYGMALAHFALGELTDDPVIVEKSVRYCSRVVECEGGECAQFWNDWGVALIKLGEMTQQSRYVEMAIDKFERAIKQPIHHIESENLDLEWVYNYGAAFDLLGDLTEEPLYFEKAVQILTHVIQVDPESAQARYHLALALSHLGEAVHEVELYYKAIDIFQDLLKQDPEDEVVHLDFGMTLTNLGLLIHDIHHLERSQKIYHQAENHFMQAAALGNSQAYYQLAGLYSLTGHYDHAMHYLERAKFFGSLPDIEDILHDEWLEELKQFPIFRQFINKLPSQPFFDDK